MPIVVVPFVFVVLVLGVAGFNNPHFLCLSSSSAIFSTALAKSVIALAISCKPLPTAIPSDQFPWHRASLMTSRAPG
jgi:hypothetical protein